MSTTARHLPNRLAAMVCFNAGPYGRATNPRFQGYLFQPYRLRGRLFRMHGRSPLRLVGLFLRFSAHASDQGILSISLTMPQFLDTFPETDGKQTSAAAFNKGIMTALLELGAFLGAIMSGFVADRYSRKWCIGFGMIWFIIGSVLQATAFSFAHLVVGRFIGGIGIGVLSSTAPMYISEIAPPNVRGAFLVLEGATIVIGIVIMFYITYGSRHIAGDWSFRLPFTAQMAPCLLLGATLWMLPYSPRWLAQVGRDRDSLDSLSRLRRLPVTDPRVQAEWITIRAEAIRNRETVVMAHPKLTDLSKKSTFMGELKLEVAAWTDMFRPGILPRTMIGIMLMFFQQFQGINAVSRVVHDLSWCCTDS